MFRYSLNFFIIEMLSVKWKIESQTQIQTDKFNKLTKIFHIILVIYTIVYMVFELIFVTIKDYEFDYYNSEILYYHIILRYVIIAGTSIFYAVFLYLMIYFIKTKN